MAEAAPDVPFYPRPRRCVSDPEENGSANPGAVDELESDNTKLAYPNSRPKTAMHIHRNVLGRTRATAGFAPIRTRSWKLVSRTLAGFDLFELFSLNVLNQS